MTLRGVLLSSKNYIGRYRSTNKQLSTVVAVIKRKSRPDVANEMFHLLYTKIIYKICQIVRSVFQRYDFLNSPTLRPRDVGVIKFDTLPDFNESLCCWNFCINLCRKVT